jgi:CHASE1-domain containing sensor protein
VENVCVGLAEAGPDAFDREAERVINLMQERIKHYEDVLLSGVAAMQSHGGEMSRSQWRQYSQFLELNQRCPGISGIGVIHYLDAQDIPAFWQQSGKIHLVSGFIRITTRNSSCPSRTSNRSRPTQRP